MVLVPCWLEEDPQCPVLQHLVDGLLEAVAATAAGGEQGDAAGSASAGTGTDTDAGAGTGTGAGAGTGMDDGAVIGTDAGNSADAGAGAGTGTDAGAAAGANGGGSSGSSIGVGRGRVYDARFLSGPLSQRLFAAAEVAAAAAAEAAARKAAAKAAAAAEAAARNAAILAAAHDPAEIGLDVDWQEAYGNGNGNGGSCEGDTVGAGAELQAAAPAGHDPAEIALDDNDGDAPWGGGGASSSGNAAQQCASHARASSAVGRKRAAVAVFGDGEDANGRLYGRDTAIVMNAQHDAVSHGALHYDPAEIALDVEDM